MKSGRIRMSRSPGRCPRCGYVLRYSTTGYSCDFCGLKRTRPASNIIASAEKTLKRKVQEFLEPRMTIPYSQPVQRSFQSCVFCGLNIPFGSVTCPACGKPQTTSLGDQDRKVFDYIAAHDGVISMSHAALDLSLPIELLASSIERLKATGILKQE
jgi:ribosomal protein L37AE/L43A